jgi:nicotinamidase-related amidase
MSKKILIVVDMQNDFIDGALGSDEAEDIVPAVLKEIQNPVYDYVFATMDTHGEKYMETYEGKHLPVIHCVKGTEGWKLNDLIEEALDKRNAVIIEKPTFGSAALVQAITAMQPDSVTLVGLCTDICVVSNALMLRAALYATDINVIEKACAGVTPDSHRAALQTMRSCQIAVI